MKTKIVLIGSLGTILLTGCSTSKQNLGLNKLIKDECNNASTYKSPWHIKNLYDCNDKSFFIPYQLWSGAKYDGDKVTSRNHQIDKQTQTAHYGKSDRLSYDELSVTGTTKWTSNKYNKEFNIYTRERDDKVQYFVANDIGIGRVYDDRGNGRYFSGTNIKFPAGYGWNLNDSRSTSYEVIKNGKTKYRNTTINITDMKFNSKNELDTITFEWYPKDNELDHIYTYKANVGLVETKRP
jgi:hypothetical protein